MTKPDRIRDDGKKTETEREAKKRNRSPEVASPLCIPDEVADPEVIAALQPSRPEMRGIGEATKVGGARVDGTTKVGCAAEEQEEELSSFTPKSPISRPYIPDELNDRITYPEILAAYEDAQVKYKAKLRHRYALAHKRNLEHSSLFRHPHLNHIRERAKKAVLRGAKSIVRLSSSVDGKPLANCCGLWIKWDEESKTGVVLTTAHLIRSKHPTRNHWEGGDEYNIEANVIVHLLDDTTTECHFLYHQEHYDLAFFKVRVDEPVQLPSFSSSVQCGQDVFRLGRDDQMDLRVTHGMVEYWNPGSNERHHYMYLSHHKDLSSKRNDDYLFHGNNDDYMCDDDGGSIIDLDGKVVGLVNNHVKRCFVPSCILDKCVDLWSEFRCIPRLHLGMKFTSIKLLDPTNVEKMWRLYKIEDGLVVEEVSEESHAEKLGICIGDIIERLNGECISTTIELENMLLGRCRDHFARGNHLNDNIDVSVQVFHTEERLRRTVNLRVDVSDGGEIIRRRTYPITEGTSASVQSSQNVADDPWVPRPRFTSEARRCA